MQSARVVWLLRACARTVCAAALLVVVGLDVATLVSTIYAGSLVTVSVVPVAPTEADTIVIKVAGNSPESCTIVSASHIFVGSNAIIVTVDFVSSPVICIPVITPFSITEEVGPLAAGIYLVDAHVPCGLSTCVGSTTFEVTGQPVGGVVELPEVAGTPLEVPGSSGTNAGLIASIVAAIAAGTVTLTGAAVGTRGGAGRDSSSREVS